MKVWIVIYVDPEIVETHEICATEEVAKQYCEYNKQGRENWGKHEGWFVREIEVLDTFNPSTLIKVWK